MKKALTPSVCLIWLIRNIPVAGFDQMALFVVGVERQFKVAQLVRQLERGNARTSFRHHQIERLLNVRRKACLLAVRMFEIRAGRRARGGGRLRDL